jgi:hypothetical protein
MSYNIIAVPTFRKELKKLAKKYPSLKTDLAILFESLEENPVQGTSLGRKYNISELYPIPNSIHTSPSTNSPQRRSEIILTPCKVPYRFL